MLSIRAVIVDDELPARSELGCILGDIPSVEVVGKCGNGKELLKFLETNEADIVFLDIEMPVMDGIQTAIAISKTVTVNPPRIVFSTGFNTFAIQAFDLAVFDYILKPYNEERILQTINRLKKVLEEETSAKTAGEVVVTQNKFSIAADSKILVLDPKEEIVLIKTDKNGSTTFCTTRGLIESRLLLKDIETRLAPEGFFRTHKGYIVNVNMIKEIEPWFNDTYMLVMKHFEKEEVPVSRTYMKAFKGMMQI